MENSIQNQIKVSASVMTPTSVHEGDEQSLLERWVRKFPKGSIWQTRFICLPLMISLSTWAFSTTVFARFSWSGKFGFFFVGALVWTLLEYVLHRWVLHFQASSRVGTAILDRLHIFHHHDPKDQSQVCIPPVLVFLQGAVLFAILFFLVRAPIEPSVFFVSGLMTMMVVYDITHFSTHYMPATNGLLQGLKKHHMLHHFSDHGRRFGVTSPFWDYVFRTHR